MAKIVVIDDDEDLQAFVEFHLKKGRHTVLAARNGFEGIELVEQHRPELIILDVMMPGLDGVDICKRLKRNEEIAQIPVIFLSAKRKAVERIRGIESGGDAYITKPFSMAELAQAIETTLHRHDH
jgi:DNA-binding response OmpR family regulator